MKSVIAFLLISTTAIVVDGDLNEFESSFSRLSQVNQVELSNTQFESNENCDNRPDLVSELLKVGRQMGVTILEGEPKMANKDATYEARYGRIGVITVSQRFMQPDTYCRLISHEFIHVLQHLNGDLRSVKPMGFDVPIHMIQSVGSLQELEAYTYQNEVGFILKLLQDFLYRFE